MQEKGIGVNVHYIPVYKPPYYQENGYENIKRMDVLMCFCDVAISAAGSTLYELCVTQTPSVTYIIADNQIPAVEAFDARGIMKNGGDIRKIGKKNLAKRLIGEAIILANNIDERKCVSEIMCTVVDGNGVGRILERILK